MSSAANNSLRHNINLDTRTKIIAASAAATHLESNSALLPVLVDLDPLYAPHAETLAAFARPLVLIVSPKPDAYLSQQARAEMAASLRCVAYVVIGEANFPHAIDLRPREAEWRQALESTVLAKSAIPEKKA